MKEEKELDKLEEIIVDRISERKKQKYILTTITKN